VALMYVAMQRSWENATYYFPHEVRSLDACAGEEGLVMEVRGRREAW
jgi:hypothetical protein